MNLLGNVITYVRRIIKSPSNASITDNLIIDYINRFYINDVDAEMQLFDLKTKYSFMTTPGVDRYNMPLYDLQLEGTAPTSDINYYPVYQGFVGAAYINGVEVLLQTQKKSFFNAWPNVVQYNSTLAVGNGTAGPYTLTFPVGTGNSIPVNPPVNAILRGHVDITGIIATGNNIDPPISTTLNTLIPSTSIDPAVYFTSTDATGANVVVQDSGQFLTGNVNYGLLMYPGTAPFGYSQATNGYLNSFAITGITNANPAVITATTNFEVGQTVQISGVAGMTELNDLTFTVTAVTATTVTINVDSTSFGVYVSGGTISSLQNVINYLTGVATNVYFPSAIPSGMNINGQCYFFQSGLPRGILFYNNVLTLRSPPSQQFLVELDAYLSPAAYLNSASAIQFGYMSEYIARGAARKILLDTGDVEQFQFYEPEFVRQRNLVWKRSQRQWTATRTETIYSRGGYGQSGNNNMGGGNFF